MRHITPLLVILLMAGCTGASGVVSHGTKKIEVKDLDDDLEPFVTVTSRHYDEPLALTRYVSDPYFRAFIDKETGVGAIQLYVRNNANDWMQWKSLRFRGADGNLVTLEAEEVRSEADCSGSTLTPCSHYEDVVFSIPREHLDALANAKTKATTTRLVSGAFSDGDRDVNLLTAEVFAFLSRVDAMHASFRQAATSSDTTSAHR